MKLRLTLLTAANPDRFFISALQRRKGTTMIMVNLLDNPYYASEAKGAVKKPNSWDIKRRFCHMAKM